MAAAPQNLTRLDKAIRRLEAQRACLDWAVKEVTAIPGIVVELGLGNGRSFDHLRARLPGREIFVFERSPAAHPASTPAAERLIIGNLEETLSTARARFASKVAFLHSDIGTGDDDRNAAFCRMARAAYPPAARPGRDRRERSAAACARRLPNATGRRRAGSLLSVSAPREVTLPTASRLAGSPG